MRWLHISDIHYDQINDGIQTLLLRDDFQRYTKKHNIRVDEVFFTGDFRHAKNQSEQDTGEVAKNAVGFLRHIAACVGVTDNDHIHIVPGNHDLDRKNKDDENNKDTKKLAESIKSYNGNFVGSSNDYLKNRFSFFEKCATLLNNQTWMDFRNGLIHRYHLNTEYSIVYLNTAIACGQKEERGKLIIGTVDLYKILSEIKKTNDRKPLIFLAHHPIEVFAISEITVIKDMINKLELPALWLCGDFHDMLENNTYELAQITTGCFKKEENIEAGFYVGEISPIKGIRLNAYLGTKRGRWEYSESHSELSNAALPKTLRWNDEYSSEYISAEHFAKQSDYTKALESNFMSTLIVSVLECPQCGAPVKQGSKTCARCYSDYIITSLSSLKRFDDSEIKKYLKAYESGLKSGEESTELYAAMGICQLQRGLYKHANSYFEKAIALLPEDGDTYYYAAIALLNGKRPFCSSLPVIRKVIEYIQLALEFSEQGSYYFLQYLIHKDYYEKKQLNCLPCSAELLDKARLVGFTEINGEELSKLIGLS